MDVNRDHPSQAIEFPTTDGRSAHGFYYPPKNDRFRGARRENCPPLFVSLRSWRPHCPNLPDFTLACNIGPRAELPLWMSTTEAVPVMEAPIVIRLRDNWGVVDVDDCANAALYCTEMGIGRPNRLAISGGAPGDLRHFAALLSGMFSK